MPDFATRRHEHWYRAKIGAPVHESVVDYGRALLAVESSFHSKNLARERMYRGVDLLNQQTALAFLERGGRSVARLNALKAICDTFSSRLSKDRPMPDIVPEGDWNSKRRAEKYQEFVVGQMMDTEFDDLSCLALIDGTKLGSGFTRIDDNEEAVFAERVPVNDLLFDRRECKYGKPRQAIRVMRVARDFLAELFPKSKDAIASAPSSLRRKDDTDVDGDGPRGGALDDYVDTWEAWRLPSTLESADGRHALCVSGTSERCTLVSERWWEPRFPWSQFQLSTPDWGIYPEGFTDLLADLQHAVNNVVRDIQLNLRATGRGFFMVNKANDIPVEMLSGMQPFKLSYNGNQPPVWNAPQSYNVAQMSALEKFIGYMFELSGVSQANATSKSALGAGASGVALDTQYDIDSDRFRIPQRNYARYRITGAQCYIDASARIARRRSESKGAKRNWIVTSWKGTDAVQKLDYNKVMLKDGSYRLRIQPQGFLPFTKAGRLAVVDQLAKAGIIPAWLAPAMFDEPDLEEANRILLSALKNCLRKMDILAEEDQPIPMPEQYNDLELELKVSTAYYNWIQCEKAPEEIQDRYRQYIDLVADAVKVKTKAAPQLPMPIPMPGMPGMPGTMPPPADPMAMPPALPMPPPPMPMVS